MKLTFITIASGSYRAFIPPLIESSARFVKGCDSIQWLVLGDRRPPGKNFAFGRVPGREWPYSTLMRFHDMLANRAAVGDADYIAYLDSDMRFVGPVDVAPWRGNFIAVRHPGFLQSEPPPFERRPESRAAVSLEYSGPYLQGCLFGGGTAEFWRLCETLRDAIDDDLKRGLIAQWHDESHMNAFFSRHAPLVLDSGYAYPEEWKLAVLPRILHLKKNHDLIRSQGLNKARIFLAQSLGSAFHRLKSLGRRVR